MNLRAGITNKRQSRIIPTPARYAVLLNARAKRWTGDLHEDVQRLVPSEDLFLTDDLQQADRTVDKMLERGYEVIFAAGGDGTLAYLFNSLWRKVQEGVLEAEDVPPIGVLRMGTGNALATYVGARDITRDLRALRGGASLLIQPVEMIDTGTRYEPFTGLGWDARVLNDYDEFKDSVRGTALENYTTGLLGYLSSIFMRTIPKVFREPPSRIRVTNRGPDAHQVDGNGEVIETFGEGEVVFEGEIRACAASTVPYWGYNIRMFPHTDVKQDYFQLRCFYGGVWDLVGHLPSFWRGHIRESAVTDLLISDVSIEVLGDAAAYQVCGEPAGEREKVRWKLADRIAELAIPV